MADSDIYKYLTMQISAKDLTGEVFDGVINSLDKMMGGTGLVNVAFAQMGNAIGTVVDILKEGGEYDETKTAFEGFATSMEVSGDRILKSLDGIAGGTKNIAELSNIAGLAIQRGFSEDQIETIFKFSKRYSELVGGSFEDVADRIGKAIITGNGKSIAGMDITIAKGIQVSEVMRQLEEEYGKLGDGAYNLGDDLIALGNVWANFKLEFSAETSRLFTNTEVPAFLESMKAAFWNFKSEIPTLAYASFVPIYETAKLIIEPVNLLIQESFSLLGSLLGDSKFSIIDFAGFVGNTIFLLEKTFMRFINVSKQAQYELTESLLILRLKAQAAMSGNLFDDTEIRVKVAALRSEFASTLYDVDAVTKRQEEYADTLVRLSQKSQLAAKESDKLAAAMFWGDTASQKAAEGLQVVGEGARRAADEYANMEKAAKSAVESLFNEKEVYDDFGKTLTETTAKMKVFYYDQNQLRVQYGGGLKYDKLGGGAVYDLTNQISNDRQTPISSPNIMPNGGGSSLNIKLSGGSEPLRGLFSWMVDELNKAAVAQGLMVAGT